MHGLEIGEFVRFGVTHYSSLIQHRTYSITIFNAELSFLAVSLNLFYFSREITEDWIDSLKLIQK